MSQVQDDIAKTKAAIDNLKTSGEVLFSDGIAALQQKLTSLEEQAAAEAQAAVTAIEEEAKQGVNDIKVAEQTFIQKYWPEIREDAKIILIAVAVIKLLGWF